jgi:hypothetical protein
VPPLQLRPNLPSVGEQVFGIHHPNGAVKKYRLSMAVLRRWYRVGRHGLLFRLPSTFRVVVRGAVCLIWPADASGCSQTARPVAA